MNLLLSARRTTLKDIARRADLSVAAVSMALRRHPSIPTATTRRVRQLADELGYAPDPMLCALAAHRQRMRPRPVSTALALISNWATREGWEALPGMSLVRVAMRQKAAEHGYRLEHFWARDAAGSPLRLREILVARGIRGVLLAPSESGDEECLVSPGGFEMVALEHSVEGRGVSHVGTDHYSNVLRCWRELRARGYSRVGLVTDAAGALPGRFQQEAAHAIMQRQHEKPEDRVPTLLVRPATTPAEIGAWLHETRPRAVIGGGRALHEALAAEHVSVLHDLGCVSLDVVQDVAGATGVDRQSHRIGELAIATLHARLIGGMRGAHPTVSSLVAGEWKEGATLRPRLGEAVAR